MISAEEAEKSGKFALTKIRVNTIATERNLSYFIKYKFYLKIVVIYLSFLC